MFELKLFRLYSNMSSLSKVCAECGLGLDLGLAHCPHCGAQVGTIFSESAPVPVSDRAKRQRNPSGEAFSSQKIDKARERGNQSLILALISFFCPGLGLAMGVSAIFLGASALSTFKDHNIEEGRGPAGRIVVGGIRTVLLYPVLHTQAYPESDSLRTRYYGGLYRQIEWPIVSFAFDDRFDAAGDLRRPFFRNNIKPTGQEEIGNQR